MTEAPVISDLKLAEFMIVGFVKCWSMRRFLATAGIPFPTDEEILRLAATYQFLPSDKDAYISCKGQGTPIRSYVSAEWPRLHDYLDRNAKNPEKLLRAASQLVKLKYRGAERAGISPADRAEIYKTRQELRRVSTANNAARRQQLSTQRSAWSVCKK